MLTKLIIRKFKGIREAEIFLDQNVVFIGPNNSGKTSALQALALWDIGLKTWLAKRGLEERQLKRSGVALNRRDLIALPVPSALLLWNDLHVRESKKKNGKSMMENIVVEIILEGVSDDKAWRCGFEFDYANTESIYCRPAHISSSSNDRMALPDDKILSKVRVAYLPPMSGLASVEPKWEPGRINVLIGEGQTAQVLRNLCLAVTENEANWVELQQLIDKLFGVNLIKPEYIAGRGEVIMGFKSRSGIELDISSTGRGMQQTLLIASYMYANPDTIILLDEPDAHLEILRQRQIFQIITDLARSQGSQLICASHSEVVLEEAAEKDTVISFVGKPHIVNDKGQLVKSLREIGFQDYYLAEAKGWVLYLEGSTDLAIIQILAEKLDHPVKKFLAAPFVRFLGNNIPGDTRKHFYALREAYSEIAGCALFDRISTSLQDEKKYKETAWRKREIENYICSKKILFSFIKGKESPDLFSGIRVQVLEECIREMESALKTLQKPSPWSGDCKVSDEFLEPLFENYLQKMNLPANSMRKKSFYELAAFIDKNDIDEEIIEKLDFIYQIAIKSEINYNI